MIKPYGFKSGDLKELAKFISGGGFSANSLTENFRNYALKTGKACGSVRNLYYALAKLSRDDADFSREYLGGNPLTVERPDRFSREENELIGKIKEYKAQGVSVRKATFLLANGDPKKALRLQNKYRSSENVKNASYISPINADGSSREAAEQTIREGFLRLRLKKEIDGLVDRIAVSVRKENEDLKRQVMILKAENRKLARELSERSRSATGYFGMVERESRINRLNG